MEAGDAADTIIVIMAALSGIDISTWQFVKNQPIFKFATADLRGE